MLYHRVSFEAGGNSPFIVFDDADIDAAVEGSLIFWPLSINSLIFFSRQALLLANSAVVDRPASVRTEFMFSLPYMPTLRQNSRPKLQLSRLETVWTKTRTRVSTFKNNNHLNVL